MRIKILIFFAMIFVISLASGCKSPQRSMSGRYTFKTECLGVEHDGSQTVKAWGCGRNRSDAIEQAYKNAIKDVLFNGINNGKPDCNIKPVIFEVNAQEKYQVYFNKFFADGGDYKEFANQKDGSRNHIEVIKDRMNSGSQATYGVIVRVLRAELITKMKTEGILK